eukprot:COSAG01_NODE_4809_length_4726_cov_9.458612_6_plen_270_part_01
MARELAELYTQEAELHAILEDTAPGAAHDPTVVELLGAVLARLRACGAAPRSGTSQPRRAANHCAIVAHSLRTMIGENSAAATSLESEIATQLARKRECWAPPQPNNIQGHRAPTLEEVLVAECEEVGLALARNNELLGARVQELHVSAATAEAALVRGERALADGRYAEALAQFEAGRTACPSAASGGQLLVARLARGTDEAQRRRQEEDRRRGRSDAQSAGRALVASRASSPRRAARPGAGASPSGRRRQGAPAVAVVSVRPALASPD